MRLLLAAAFAAVVLASGAGATSIARVTLPQMESSARVVPIADVTGFSGGTRLVRYTLDPVRFLRGGRSRRVTLTSIRLPDISLGLETGRRYLIFAERRTFFGRWNRLAPVGYPQGIYPLLDERVAANEVNGRVEIDRLARRLRR